MNTMNTVETQEEKNNQLRLFMETNKPVCAVHPACTLEWVDATHSFHLGCPWFTECKYKVLWLDMTAHAMDVTSLQNMTFVVDKFAVC